MINQVIEQAAKMLAACMDYPWDHMPEQGRENMRKHAGDIVSAAVADERERLRIEVLRAQIRCGTSESGGMTIGSFDMSMFEAFRA